MIELELPNDPGLHTEAAGIGGLDARRSKLGRRRRLQLGRRS